jgi:hypothetical protein
MKIYGGGIVPPFLTFALDGGESSVSRSGRIFLGKGALYRRLDGPQSRSGHSDNGRNVLPPSGNRTPAVQPVDCRYTD